MKENWKHKWHEIIFGTETKAGRTFDVILLWAILISVVAVVLESLPEIGQKYYNILFIIECVLTGIFTLEYIGRILVSPDRRKYVFSLWGFIDLLAIVPFYLIIIFPSSRYFLMLRLFRLLRVFRILKLLRFIKESQYILRALKDSAYKIAVFILAVITFVILAGTLMYVIEGPENGYTSIPQSIYWTIVTITTVGYGDITPHTSIGKIIASIIMLCGYAIIAVPTGIVTVEMSKQREGNIIACNRCKNSIPGDSNYCKVCGEEVVKEVPIEKN